MVEQREAFLMLDMSFAEPLDQFAATRRHNVDNSKHFGKSLHTAIADRLKANFVMVTRAFFCATLLTLAAAAPDEPDKIMVMGRGYGSCAAWVNASDAVHAQGNQWILGFMTGANSIWLGAQVGKQTDPEGILGEVELICKADPSRDLANATHEVWKKLLKEGR